MRHEVGAAAVKIVGGQPMSVFFGMLGRCTLVGLATGAIAGGAVGGVIFFPFGALIGGVYGVIIGLVCGAVNGIPIGLVTALWGDRLIERGQYLLAICGVGTFTSALLGAAVGLLYGFPYGGIALCILLGGVSGYPASRYVARRRLFDVSLRIVPITFPLSNVEPAPDVWPPPPSIPEPPDRDD